MSLLDRISSDKARERIVSDFLFTDAQLDLMGKALALENDPDVKEVEISYEDHRGSNARYGFGPWLFKQRGSTRFTPFYTIRVEVRMKRIFADLSEFQQFLKKSEIPARYAMQWCSGSFSVEREEDDMDKEDPDKLGISIHFG